MDKLEIIAKAWTINPNNLSEPYFVDVDIPYYGTKGQAKQLALVDNATMQTMDGEDLSFLNIRVQRNKNYDKHLFRGEILTQARIDYRLKTEERNAKLLQLLKDNPNGKAFIYNGNYRGYWGWDESGYMSDKYKAGIYDLKEAVNIVSGSCLDRKESVELIDVEKHNDIINKKIEDLKKYIL